MTRWEFVIKQDGLIVARGEGEDKEFILSEAGHYFYMYEEEDFKKMTLEVKEEQ